MHGRAAFIDPKTLIRDCECANGHRDGSHGNVVRLFLHFAVWMSY